MSSSTLSQLELEVSDELKSLGFSKILIKAKNIFVSYNQLTLICAFYKDDWEKTVKSIQKKFQSENIDKKSLNHFIVCLGREYIKLYSDDPKSSDTEKEKILDEIKKNEQPLLKSHTNSGLPKLWKNMRICETLR